MNVFVDTNVLLDVLARREPFYEASAGVWTVAETGQVSAAISALSLPNLYYILRRGVGERAARRAMGLIRDTFTLVPLDVQITNQGVDSSMKDFEDAIQFFSALRAEADVLITRNPKHFPAGDVAVQTPAMFLATHFPE